jgi:hypothetical protein
MGWALYLRPHTNKHGKNDIFYRVTSVDGQIKKTIPNCKVRPEDFNKRTNQVNGRSDNATIINETLNATTTLLQKGWGLYESGNYTWDELKSFLGGNRPEHNLETFINSYLKDDNKEQVFNGIKDAYGSAKKYLQKDITFKDLNYNTTNKLINLWKDNLRSKSVSTYKYHWSLIVNAAYKKKYTPYKFENEKKWQTKKEKVSIQGNPYVTTATPEDFLQAVDKCTNLMHVNGLGFWLFSFGMRGMYFTDLNVLHQRTYDITIDHPDYGDSVIIKHFRNKTEEPMWLLQSYPFDQLQRKLRGYLEYTHGEATHHKTKKLLRKTKENHLSYKESNGWFFKEYNKARWNTISKQCSSLGFPAIKYARKTFETVALTLEVSAEIRDRLLGHEVQGVKKSYQNWEWDELQEKVHKAHMEVLDKFRVEELYNALINKANEILEGMGVDVEEFNDNYKC